MSNFPHYKFRANVLIVMIWGVLFLMTSPAWSAGDALPSLPSRHPPALSHTDDTPAKPETVNPFDLIIEKESKKPEGMTSWRSTEDMEKSIKEKTQHDVDEQIKSAVRQMHAVTDDEAKDVMKHMQQGQQEEHGEKLTESQKALVEKFAHDKSDKVGIDLKSWEPSRARGGSYSSQAPQQGKTNNTGLEMPKRLWSVD